MPGLYYQHLPMNFTVPDTASTGDASFSDLGYMPMRSQRGRNINNGSAEEFNAAFYLRDLETQDHFSTDLVPGMRVAKLFRRIGIGAEHKIYANETFSDSEIDLQQLIAHECFHPVNQEIIDCIKQFGPYYNLGAAMESGLLRDLLITGNPDVTQDMQRLYDLMVMQLRQEGVFVSDQILQQPLDLSATATPELSVGGMNLEEERGLFDLSFTKRMDLRAQFVWAVCSGKYHTWGGAAMCYQRNERLVSDNDMGLHIDGSEIEENIQ